MKKRMEKIAYRAARNPVLRESAKALKPDRSPWGVVGVLLFFIFPEIAGFGWGEEIAAYAHDRVLTEPDIALNGIYRILEMLFEDGGSWINLFIGFALLFWLLYDWKKDRASSGDDEKS